MAALDLGLFLETIDVRSDELDIRDAIRIIEDYKPLDVQSAVMGLALCREVARQHGGDVTLVPAVGPGAIFRLVLPAGAGDMT